jgi:plastocyanin
MNRSIFPRLCAYATAILILLQSCSTDSNSNYEIDNSQSNEQRETSNSYSDDVNTTSLEFDITNSGSSSYVFNSDDLKDVEDPDITLKRGVTYTFNIDAPGHPFYINTVQNTSVDNAYNKGVTNNGAASGTITFEVPSDAPDTLYYICEFHSSMTGVFTIED